MLPTHLRPYLRLRKLLNRLFPSVCRLCAGNADGVLCAACSASLPRQSGERCAQCDLPLPSGATLCAECLHTPPHFTRVVSAYRYAFPIDLMIHDFKNRYGLAWLGILAAPLVERIREVYAAEPLPDLLLPVPLHWQRQLRRGYNQSQLIANYLIGELQLPSQRLLKKSHKTESQQGLGRRQRRNNLHRVFQLVGKVEGRHIALVDDVMTTGATTRAISSLLIKAGAQRVDVWVLARTPKPAE